MATFRKQKNGKITAEVCVKGIRKSKTWDTKARAKSWAAEQEYLLGLQAEGVSHTHTLGDVFSRYAEEVSNNKKGAQWEIVRLNSFQRHDFARVKLVDLRREHFERWIDMRLSGDKPVKPSSVNRDLNLISHCLTQARRWRLMSANPMADLKRPKNPPHRDRRITDGEIDRLLLVTNYDDSGPVKQQQQRVAVAFLIALETAMRQGELCGILPEHLNLDQKTVFLPETKNGVPRHVPLTSEAVRLFRKLEPFEPGVPVFKLSPGALSTLFRRYVARADIKDLTFHDSRHEAITRLAKKLDVLDLARMVGHRDIKQLMTYFNKSAQELAQQLD